MWSVHCEIIQKNLLQSWTQHDGSHINSVTPQAGLKEATFSKILLLFFFCTASVTSQWMEHCCYYLQQHPDLCISRWRVCDHAWCFCWFQKSVSFVFLLFIQTNVYILLGDSLHVPMCLCGWISLPSMSHTHQINKSSAAKHKCNYSLVTAKNTSF